MTDNLPAVPEPERARDVARADTDSWTEVVGEVAKFAGYVADTEFVPRGLRGNPAAATAAIMYGREVGLPPMTALTQTHVIEGKPALSAEAKRALVLAAGHEIQTIESTGGICRMRARRRGAETWSAEVVWTIDMARAAGLLGKTNWKSYPRQMLTARCSGELCDREFPDVIFGFRTLEDLQDLGGEEADAVPVELSTRVTRKRAPAAKASPGLPAPRAAQGRRPGPVGPPLPGEEGYETGKGKPGQEAASEGPGGSSDAADDQGGVVDAEPVEVGASGKDGQDAAPSEDPGAREAQVEERPAPGSGRKASGAQKRMVEAQLTNLGIDSNDREERRAIVSGLLGIDLLESMNDLTAGHAPALIDTLARCEHDPEKLRALLDEADRNRQERDQ